MGKGKMSLSDTSRVSRSIKKTPFCNTNEEGFPCCPSCGKRASDSVDYEGEGKDGDVVFYYRCKGCGQTYRRVINIKNV